ncbi:MAG: hypothetical protein ACYCSF_11705 [Acidimicrobiales bacterium]
MPAVGTLWRSGELSVNVLLAARGSDVSTGSLADIDEFTTGAGESAALGGERVLEEGASVGVWRSAAELDSTAPFDRRTWMT